MKNLNELDKEFLLNILNNLSPFYINNLVIKIIKK